LREEVEELSEATSVEEITDEAADVANFAMMYVDVVRGLPSAKPEGET